MEQVCPKCGKSKFSIVKRDDKTFCYVCCDSCGCVVGTLEDIDFKKEIKTAGNRYDKVIRNHAFFESRLNEMQEKIEKIEKMSENIIEQNEIISNQVDMLKRTR